MEGKRYRLGRGFAVLLAAALVVAGLSGATAAKKGLTKKKANKLYVNVGEKASDSDLLDGTDSGAFALDSEVFPAVLAADGTGSGLNADLLDGMTAAELQAVAHSYCDLVAEPANHAPCNTFVTTVDAAANDVGADGSLAIGVDGNPVISYNDFTAKTLRVVKCNDPACTGGNETITIVDDPADEVGMNTSLAIGADGNPVIAYRNVTDQAVWVARCNDPACTGGGETTNQVDDQATNSAFDISLAMGTDGNPVISYNDPATDVLKIAACNDPACAGNDDAGTVVDDPANEVGRFSSIAIGTDGNPVIAHYDDTANALRVTGCNDPACTGGGDTSTTVHDSANDVGQHLSMAIGADGNPVISYRDSDAQALLVARCNDPACTGGGEAFTTLEDGNDVGQFTSIAIGIDGNPVISYHDNSTGSMNVVRCDDAACAGGGDVVGAVDDTASDVGLDTSVAIGVDGSPVIGYHDNSGGNLKVARIPA